MTGPGPRQSAGGSSHTTGSLPCPTAAPRPTWPMVGVAALTNCDQDPALLCQAALDELVPAARQDSQAERDALGRRFSWCCGSYHFTLEEIANLTATVELDGDRLAAHIAGAIDETW